MKIIDTFLFSEPHEKDLLKVKFNLENNVVDKWVILESEYTFQGQYKGFHAENILKLPEFKDFIHKVVVIRTPEGFNPLHGNVNEENKNFDRENHQRAMAIQYINQECDNEDWIMISDTDEAIDFSDNNRKNIVLDLLNSQGLTCIKIQRMRYWYDFDNRCYLKDIHIPLVKAGLIKANNQAICMRHYDITKANFNDDYAVAFEYSYCFPSLEDVWRKKQTYSHTGFTLESVENGLKYNHWPRSILRGEKVGNDPYDFFERVTLEEHNSPKYVRDNLESLKTNIVDINYKENRGIIYGIQS